MAEPRPTGKLLATDGGHDLALTRSFQAGIEEVWADVTEPERTARWFGSWAGDGAPGEKITYRMLFEEGEPEAEMTIERCEVPRRLEVRSVDDHGSWHLELRLREAGGETTLELLHHLDSQTQVGMVGPGWEYYLDMLVAARAGLDRPGFEDYFPSQQPYYEGLVSQ